MVVVPPNQRTQYADIAPGKAQGLCRSGVSDQDRPPSAIAAGNVKSLSEAAGTRYAILRTARGSVGWCVWGDDGGIGPPSLVLFRAAGVTAWRNTDSTT